MKWLICLLLTSNVVSIFGQSDGKNIEEIKANFKRQLEEEQLKMLRLHADEMSQVSQPPPFDMPQNFMRSFIPGNGFGNREDLVIGRIKEIPVFHDSNCLRWHYKRFNNTDYILGVNNQSIILRDFDSSQHEYFAFPNDDAILNFRTDPWSVIKDVTMFTRSVKRSVALFLAILAEGAITSRVHIFEVIEGKGVPVSLIDLGINPSISPFSARKIDFVKSQFKESLVVLINSPNDVKLTATYKGSNELNHYIEVHSPSAVDLVTFSVLGHGYVAVANASTCEIFKSDKYAQFSLFDRIILPAGDLVDLEYFRLGFNHYMAVSGKRQQNLYVLKAGELALAQTIVEDNIGQVYSSILPTCRDDVILFFISDAKVAIYIFDGKENKFVPSNAVTPPTFRITSGSITSFSYKDKMELIFQYNERLEAFVIETSLKPVRNPILEAGENVADFMKRIQQMLEEQLKQIQAIKEVLRNAVRTNGDQYITAFQTFDNLHSNKGTTVSNEQTIFVEWDSSSLTLEQYRNGTAKLESSIAELEKTTEEIGKIIPDIVRIDEDVEITGTKIFLGDVSGTSISAYAVNLQTIAGINVPQLQNEIYRLDKPQQIKGTLTFDQPLTIKGNLDVEGTINGIDISKDVMTTNTEQTSDAVMMFKNKVIVQEDLSISGKLNEIDISEEVVTLDGFHKITGKKNFQNGIIAGHVETDFIDGIDIKEEYARALTKSGDQEIFGSKTFSGGLETNNITLHGFLNGFNIEELTNIVRIDRPAFITGHKTFLDDVYMQDELTVQGTVNGLKIPDDLFLTDVNQIVTGPKTFVGTVTANNVEVKGAIDDVDIPEDIVTLSGNEEIAGELYFTEGINVQNDILVSGLVDGVDIAEVARQALKLNESSTFTDAVFLGPVTIADNLVVGGTVNGIDLGKILDDIVYKDDTDVEIESEKHFSKVTAQTVKLERMINGYNISVDFMKVHGNQIINGTKTFKQPVIFKSINIRDGMIGDLNITETFEHRISLEIEDEIEGDTEFADHVIVEGNLIVHGTVGGLRIPEDIVLKNSKTPIANKIFTNTVQMDNLIVNGNAEISGKFGGIDLAEFYKNRITLTSEQVIEGDVWIGNSSAETMELLGTINGLDIIEFSSNVMSKTKDQEILAEKIFKADTIVGAVTTKKGINGINVAEANQRAFKLHGDNLINQPFEFEDLTVNDIQITGYINGINLTNLAEDGLKKTGYQVATGINTFKAGFQVNGNIETDLVNDLFLPQDVLLKNVPQNINGQFTIETLRVDGDMHIDGLVNGMDLSEIAPKIIRSDQEAIIESDVTFLEPIYVSQDVQVTGVVNGIDLKRISDTLLLKEGDQVITGNKIIKGSVIISGDIDVENVNGYHWQSFLADIVRIDKPQAIKSPKIFTMDTEINHAYATEANIGLINGKNLQDFMKDVVFIDTPTRISGRKVFATDVEITGNFDAEFINELRLKEDVITLSCNETDDMQVITGEKSFNNLTVFGDIHVSGKVNSYNLLDLFEDTLLIDGDQTVTGTKTLDEAAFLGDVHPGTVNGMKLQRELVTLNTEQEIEGPLIFNENVVVEKDLYVKGLINEVDITTLAEEAVYLDTNETIEGEYVFETALTPSDVAVDGLVNGINLASFDENVDSFWSDIFHGLETMENLSDDSCELSDYLQDVFSKSYYILDGFVFLQKFKYPASFLHVKSSQDIELAYLTDGPSNAVAVLHTWVPDANAFIPLDESATSAAKTLIQTIDSFEIKLNIGIDYKDSFVSVDSLPLNVPGGFADAAIWVRSQKETVMALLFPYKGICRVYLMSSSYSTSNLHVENYGEVNVGKESSSIAIFEIMNTTYLALANLHEHSTGGFSKIYSRVNGDWKLFQNIHVTASPYIKHFFYHGYHYLIFSNNAPVYETRVPKSIQIYRFSESNRPRFTLFQKIPFDDAKGIEFFEFGDLSDLYITTWNETRIQVFRLEGESGLRTSFIIHGKCIKDVKVLLIDGEVYLIAGQQNLKSDQPLSSILYKGLTKGTKYSRHVFKHC